MAAAAERINFVIVECDLSTVDPDAVTVEALARLQLGARRNGCSIRLLHSSSRLTELIDFMGLEDVFGYRLERAGGLATRRRR